MPGRQSHDCFDFRLRSDLPLDELGPGHADDDRPVVDVRLGRVPEILPEAAPAVWGLQQAGGVALLTVPAVARYLVRGGCEVVVEALPGASERDVRLFLLGSVLGIVCHQRGLLPLHANAIVCDGGAYAFAGPSGAGKSTLAARFARAGYPVLSDDVCAIGFDPAGIPLAWPGLPRLKLWHEAALAFGHDPASLERAIEGLDKYHVPLPARVRSRPVPLRRLYLLSRHEEEGEGGMTRLRGHAAVEALMAQTYRNAYLAPLGLQTRHFRQCVALASRIEVYAAHRAWGFEVFEREAARLERHIRERA